MLQKFYPYEYVKSVFHIDYGKLYQLGYRGIIFDIDNTLVHHGDDSTPEVDTLFREIQAMGFQTLLLTDNNEKRVKRFMEHMDSLYICEAGKPNPDGYFKALEMLKLERDKVVVIGDQVFRDILGANKSGIPSILVEFIRKDPNAKIGKRRQLEKVILKFYRWNKKAQHRIGDVTK